MILIDSAFQFLLAFSIDSNRVPFADAFFGTFLALAFLVIAVAFRAFNLELLVSSAMNIADALSIHSDRSLLTNAFLMTVSLLAIDFHLLAVFAFQFGGTLSVDKDPVVLANTLLLTIMMRTTIAALVIAFGAFDLQDLPLSAVQFRHTPSLDAQQTLFANATLFAVAVLALGIVTIAFGTSNFQFLIPVAVEFLLALVLDPNRSFFADAVALAGVMVLVALIVIQTTQRALDLQLLADSTLNLFDATIFHANVFVLADALLFTRFRKADFVAGLATWAFDL